MVVLSECPQGLYDESYRDATWILYRIRWNSMNHIRAFRRIIEGVPEGFKKEFYKDS